MTMQSVGVQFWPEPILTGSTLSSALGANAITFDATNDQLAWVGVSPYSTSLKTLYFRTGTLTTARQMRMGVYALNTSGQPDLTPTLWSANGTGAAPYGDTTISGANTWQTFTLTDAAVLVPGDMFAIVLSCSDASAPSFLALQASTALAGLGGLNPMYLFSNGGGAYAFTGNAAPLLWIAESTTANDVLHFPGMLPLNGGGTLTAFSTGATPDERALKFTAPAKWRIIGMRIAAFNLAAASAFTASLWDSTADGADGQTPLAQAPSFDGDSVYATTQDGYINVYFSTPYTVAAGTTYYAGVRNTTANAITVGDMTTAGVTNAIRAFGIGSNLACLGTRTWSGTNPGAWTDTTTTLPLISLIIDQADDGVQTQGGLRLAGHGGLAS